MSAYKWLYHNSYQDFRPVKHAWRFGNYVNKLKRQYYTGGYQEYLNALDHDWRNYKMMNSNNHRPYKSQWQKNLKIYDYKRWLKHARKWAKISRRRYKAQKALESNLAHYKRKHPEATLDDYILDVGKRVKYI